MSRASCGWHGQCAMLDDRANRMKKPGRKHWDVVIVGGGVMGCASAWDLARAGLRVTVLERSVPAALEASAPGTLRSSTVTRSPARARSQALAQPITPPPTMTTSQCFLPGFFIRFARSSSIAHWPCQPQDARDIERSEADQQELEA